jgi:hypothetical protein
MWIMVVVLLQEAAAAACQYPEATGRSQSL